jgi:hypothetical protein
MRKFTLGRPLSKRSAEYKLERDFCIIGIAYLAVGNALYYRQ